MLEKVKGISTQVKAFWGKHAPDIYTTSDAGHILSKIDDKKYLLGEDKINPQSFADKAKIWSLPPEVFGKVQDIVKEAGHFQPWPFVMGTYDMSDQKMRMNDVCMTDPWSTYLIATKGLEGFAMPVLRGLYYAGRRSWWRHESIHARHHLQMAHYLNEKENSRFNNDWQSRSRLEEAGLTIHESGIEELLTRWQSFQEARGISEKGASSISLLLYLEYASFTGIRNLFIDGKEKTLDLVPMGAIRVPAKIAVGAGLLFGPAYLDGQNHFMDGIGEAASQVLPIAAKQAEALLWRVQTYVGIAAVAAMFSSKEKGAFRQMMAEGEHLPTTEYKFPYVYSPVTSVARSVHFLRYLSRVWDRIPNYRNLETSRSVDKLEKQIDDKLAGHMSDKQQKFTMQVLEDALEPAKKSKRSSFPQEVYVKGMFTPALYLKLRELYRP